jgi:hypothetical protein
MKAEHRHQLQTNLLADRMGRLVRGVKTSPTSTSPLVWAFAVLTLAVIIIWQISASSSSADAAAQWAKLDEALQLPITTQDDAKKYDETMREVEKEEGTIASRTAMFQRARQIFLDGQENLTATSVNREQGIARIKAARDLYDQLSKQCADSPPLAQQAFMGIARAEESLVATTPGGDPRQELEAAIGAYQTLATKYPDSALGKDAADHAQKLQGKLDLVQKFYVELTDIAGPKPPPKGEPKPELEPNDSSTP